MYLHCSNFSLDTAAFTKPVNFKVEPSGFTFACAKSQNLARLREIAKINTRKIVGIPKPQNFVLANNSNSKVVYTSTLGLSFDVFCKIGRGCDS